MQESTADSAALPADKRLGLSHRGRERLLAAAVILLWLLLWEFSIRWGLLDPRFFFPPTTIAATFVSMWLQDNLAVHIANSVQRLAIGFGLGAVPGLLLGRLIARSGWLRAGCGPLLVIWWSFPALALFPLIMLIFGLGDASKWNVVAYSVFFLVVYQSWTRASSKPITPLAVGQASEPVLSDQQSRLDLVGTQPLFADLKLAAWAAVLTLIPAEFVGAKSGIGSVIWISFQSFHAPQMYVGMVLAGALGTLAWLTIDFMARLTHEAVTRRAGGN